MDQLPNDPSNPNSGNNTPPPFGTNFNPHVNPPDPNNPYTSQPPQLPLPQTSSYPTSPNIPNSPNTPNPSGNTDSFDLKDPAQAEVAKHQPRDSHGRFASDHLYSNPQTSLNTPNLPNIPQENSFMKALKFIIKIKWAKVSFYIISFIGVVNLIINLPTVKNFIEANFPNSSPVFGREVTMQGTLKNSNLGLYTLVLPNQELYTLHFKPSVSLTSLKKVNEAVVKGHLGWTPYVIEQVEIFPLNFTIPDDADSSSKSSTSQTIPNTQNSPNNPDSSSLPPLYSKLTWEITKTKTLIFTSGMRKIEQEGVYLESSQVTAFPQEFINYYTKDLSNLGFKQTLNSQEPTGTTITFAKDDLFLTFGVKNIFKGSGDSKTISGYKAFIEHN